MTELVGDSSSARGTHPKLAARSLSERTHVACLLILTLWPYALAPTQVTLAALGLVSIVALLNRPLQLPKLSPFLVFFSGWFGLVLGLRLLAGDLNWFVLSQSNHLVQFTIYYYAFIKIAQGCNWASVLSSRAFLIAAGIATVVYSGYLSGLGEGENQNDLSITLLALLAGLFLRGQRRSRLLHYAIIACFGAVGLFTTGRSSVAMLLAVILVAYWVPLPRRLTLLAVALILIMPIAFYLWVDPQTLIQVYAFDHNTGIRAEFVRGASHLLEQSPAFGLGFGGPYRPINFPYLYRHPLLNDLDAVHIVSNHHSLFDIAFRLGIPSAAVFAIGVFWSPMRSTHTAIVSVLGIVAAFGLSFNAWLENQYMLPQLVLLIALMQAPGKEPEVLDEDYERRTNRGRPNS